MHDVGDVIFLDGGPHGFTVADVNFFKVIFWIFVHAIEVFQVACVGEAIHVNQEFNAVLINDVTNEVGSDKSGTAGN